MISKEFKAAVAAGNLLRTRIMLKDSFLVDTSFKQLDEMLEYAKRKFPRDDLLMPPDDEILEKDSSKWNQEVMNMELIQLVNNFSEEGISHLKKVVKKVKGAENKESEVQKKQTESKKRSVREKTRYSSGSKSVSENERLSKQILDACEKISDILPELRKSKKWNEEQIDELGRLAQQLLNATQKYK